jgi:LIM homeobox transcription factor 1
MENFRGNFFDSYQNNSGGEMRNQYYDPFFVKHRKRTTKAQLKVLEQTFETNIRPDANMRKKLGEQLGMTPRSVQVWFQNRRAKIKKLTQKKTTQQENTDNARDTESKLSTTPTMDYRYSGYHPYAPVQARAPGEEFDVYPSSNSIYNYPVGRNVSAPYEGYGYRGHEEYGYPYAHRYPPEYYPMQYQYSMGPQQWQPTGGKEDEYYQMARKSQPSNDESYNDERM